MSASNPESLIAAWRDRAHTLERFGDPLCARLWSLAAEELMHALAASHAATVSVPDAAKRTGYTADHLRALIKRGVIPNAGRKGAPCIRVADLPPRKTPGGPGRPPRPRLVLSARARSTTPHQKEERP
jgi:hypothetical protein